jgi:ABC-type glutathione transport system ATPase component
MDLLERLRETHRLSILFITHNLGLVSRMCEEICVLYAGSVVELGKTEDVLCRPYHPYTQLLLKAIPKLDLSQKREETSQGKKWVPFSHDVRLLYFWGDVALVVNWEDDGEKIKAYVNPMTGRPYSNVWMLPQTERDFFFREGLALERVIAA